MPYLCTRFQKATNNTVPVVQLVRASDCGSECRGFESHRAPSKRRHRRKAMSFFVRITNTLGHRRKVMSSFFVSSNK